MKGFSLVEIIVAMVLLVGLGIVAISSFSSSAKVVNTDLNIAYDFARGLMERMPEQVRQDTWATAGLPLSLSAPGPQNVTSVVNGQTFTAAYQVNAGSGAPLDVNADGQEDYRKVKMTVIC
jgi:hypothetical protein